MDGNTGYLIISSLFLFFTPLIFILREEKIRAFLISKTAYEKFVYIFLLISSYLITRLIYILIYNQSLELAYNEFGLSYFVASLSFIGVDTFYWILIKKIEPYLFKDQPLITKIVGFYYIEYIIVTPMLLMSSTGLYETLSSYN